VEGGVAASTPDNGGCDKCALNYSILRFRYCTLVTPQSNHPTELNHDAPMIWSGASHRPRSAGGASRLRRSLRGSRRGSPGERVRQRSDRRVRGAGVPVRQGDSYPGMLQGSRRGSRPRRHPRGRPGTPRGSRGPRAEGGESIDRYRGHLDGQRDVPPVQTPGRAASQPVGRRARAARELSHELQGGGAADLPGGRRSGRPRRSPRRQRPTSWLPPLLVLHLAIVSICKKWPMVSRG
jgi:hypothetical protein